LSNTKASEILPEFQKFLLDKKMAPEKMLPERQEVRWTHFSALRESLR
jgi:hypothetical protein